MHDVWMTQLCTDQIRVSLHRIPERIIIRAGIAPLVTCSMAGKGKARLKLGNCPAWKKKRSGIKYPPYQKYEAETDRMTEAGYDDRGRHEREANSFEDGV